MTIQGIRVIVVDDHELFRRGIIGLLDDHDIQVVGEAATAAEAIRQARELEPDVVLLDLNMPGMSGVEATHRLITVAPRSRILVLTMMADDDSLMNALRAGACGYLLKDASIHQIMEGVAAAASGESVISPRVATRLVRRLREPSALEPHQLAASQLTTRELQVLELVSQGLDNGEIAHALYLSQHTVKNHVSSIMIKLEVENRTQAAVRAVRAGLVN